MKFKIITLLLCIAGNVLLFLRCNNECYNYSQPTCESALLGNETWDGNVNDSQDSIGIKNCTITIEGLKWNDSQCGDTQCQHSASTTTDSTGYFIFENQPNGLSELTITASKDGYTSSSIVRESTLDRNFTLLLTPN